MGRSRGGLTTKIHAVSDVTGLPIRYDLSPGQAHDTTAAGAMLATLPPDSFLVADKAYDAEWIRDLIEQRDAVPIIPDRERVKTKHAFSKPLRLRNRIERAFNKLKQFPTSPHDTKTGQLPCHDHRNCKALDTSLCHDLVLERFHFIYLPALDAGGYTRFGSAGSGIFR